MTINVLIVELIGKENDNRLGLYVAAPSFEKANDTRFWAMECLRKRMTAKYRV